MGQNNRSEYVLACYKERVKIKDGIRIKRNCKAIPKTKMPPGGASCVKLDEDWKKLFQQTNVDKVPLSEVEGIECVCTDKDGCNSGEGKFGSLFATLVAAGIAKMFA